MQSAMLLGQDLSHSVASANDAQPSAHVKHLIAENPPEFDPSSVPNFHCLGQVLPLQMQSAVFWAQDLTPLSVAGCEQVSIYRWE